MQHLVSQIKAELSRAENETKRLRQALRLLTKGQSGALSQRRPLSAEARKRISKAQVERWAEWKKKNKRAVR